MEERNKKNEKKNKRSKMPDIYIDNIPSFKQQASVCGRYKLAKEKQGNISQSFSGRRRNKVYCKNTDKPYGVSC